MKRALVSKLYEQFLPLSKIFRRDCIQSLRCGVMLAERKNGNSQTTCRQSCQKRPSRNFDFRLKAPFSHCMSARPFSLTKKQGRTEQGASCCGNFRSFVGLSTNAADWQES